MGSDAEREQLEIAVEKLVDGGARARVALLVDLAQKRPRNRVRSVSASCEAFAPAGTTSVR